MRSLSRRLAAVVALAACAVYARALTNPFVFDDRRTIVENASIRDLGNWRWIVLGSRRPLVNASYALDYALGGLSPIAFHVTNVGLHALNALLVFALARRVIADAAARRGEALDERRTSWASFASALAFAVHPALSEAVGYASGRAGVMCATCVLASLLLWRRGLDGARAATAAALIAFACGLGSKETAGMLPLAYLGYDRWLAPGDAAARRRRWWRFHAPLLAVCAAGALWRVGSYVRLEGGGVRPAWQYWMTELGVVWRYLALLAAPVSQSVVHAIAPVETLLDARPWLAGGALVAATVLVARRARRAPALAFGWAWFLGFLLPVCAVPLVEVMAEHRVYEASVGLFLIAAALGAAARGPWPRRLAWVAVPVLALATVARTGVWADPIALWRDAAAKAPTVWAPRYELANALREAGDCARAADQYRAAIALLDRDPRAYINLGICEARLGRADEAEAALRAAVLVAPDDATAHFDLALVELDRRPDDARAHLHRALALAPDYAKPKKILARLDAGAGER
jgi:protein O-mannosyl-transferase